MRNRQIELHADVVGPRADRMRLPLIVRPDLDVRRTPPRLIALLQEPPHGLLRDDAPKQPLRPTLHRPRHLAECTPFALPQHDVRHRLQPKRGVALEDRIGDVGDPRRRDGGGRLAQRLHRQRMGEVGFRRRQHQSAILHRHTFRQLLVAIERKEQRAVSVRDADIGDLRVDGAILDAQIALEACPLPERRHMKRQMPQPERQRKRPFKPRMASPKRKPVRNNRQEPRVDLPLRQAREGDRILQTRHLHLVVEPALAPEIGPSDALKSPARIQPLRIDLVVRPVDTARVLEFLRHERLARRHLIRKREKYRTDGRRDGGIGMILPD